MSKSLPRTVSLSLAIWMLVGLDHSRAESIHDTLCNFPVEGLTLASTKADVDKVYKAKGWHDLSIMRTTQKNNIVVDRIQYDRTRKADTAEEVAADKDGPLGRFQLTVQAGVGVGINIIDNTGRSPLARAQDLCAALVGKFDVNGCELLSSGHRIFSITARPKVVSGEWCQVHMSGRLTTGGNYDISVTRNSEPPAERRPNRRQG